MPPTDLVKQCLKVCLWIPLTMVKSLLLNSSLLKIRIPALAFNCSYASSEKKQHSESIYSLRIPLTFADSTYNLRNPLTVAESRTTSYIRLLRKPRHKKCADGNFVMESTYILKHVQRLVSGI